MMKRINPYSWGLVGDFLLKRKQRKFVNELASGTSHLLDRSASSRGKVDPEKLRVFLSGLGDSSEKFLTTSSTDGAVTPLAMILRNSSSDTIPVVRSFVKPKSWSNFLETSGEGTFIPFVEEDDNIERRLNVMLDGVSDDIKLHVLSRSLFEAFIAHRCQAIPHLRRILSNDDNEKWADMLVNEGYLWEGLAFRRVDASAIRALLSGLTKEQHKKVLVGCPSTINANERPAPVIAAISRVTSHVREALTEGLDDDDWAEVLTSTPKWGDFPIISGIIENEDDPGEILYWMLKGRSASSMYKILQCNGGHLLATIAMKDNKALLDALGRILPKNDSRSLEVVSSLGKGLYVLNLLFARDYVQFPTSLLHVFSDTAANGGGRTTPTLPPHASYDNLLCPIMR